MLPAEDVGGTPAQAVRILYTNWQRETAIRRIVPLLIYFGKTRWHTGPQWFLRARDVDKDAERDFALRDVLEWGVPETEVTQAWQRETGEWLVSRLAQSPGLDMEGKLRRYIAALNDELDRERRRMADLTKDHQDVREAQENAWKNSNLLTRKLGAERAKLHDKVTALQEENETLRTSVATLRQMLLETADGWDDGEEYKDGE